MIPSIKAHRKARQKIKRYIEVLTICASGIDKILWGDFEFAREFLELKQSNCVTGDILSPVEAGEKDFVQPGITVEGMSKLTEYSEYVWNTSYMGRAATNLVRTGWIIVGVLIASISPLLTPNLQQLPVENPSKQEMTVRQNASPAGAITKKTTKRTPAINGPAEPLKTPHDN